MFNFKKFFGGIRLIPKSASDVDTKGELEVIDSTGKMGYHDGSTVSPVVTETHASQGSSRLKNKDLEDSSTKIVDSSDTTKKIAFDAGGTTGTTTTITGAQTANRTLTLPDATDTLVGKATTDVLTNKSIDADTNTITNIENADIKAGAAIDRLKLASGTADHVIINNGSGVLSSEATLAKSRGGSAQDNSSITFPASGVLVTEAGIETLSNKSFSDAVTQTEISTPSTPASTKWKLYPKTDGYYQLNDAGIETKFSTNIIGYAIKTHTDTGTTLVEGFTLWTLTDGNNNNATIPAASSNAGKVFIIKLAASTASANTLTLNRSGSDTFTLADGTTSATSVVLYTSGEYYEIISDGTSVWQVLNHRTNTAWNNSLTFTQTSFGTTTNVDFWTKRVGDSLEIVGYFKSGTNTGVDAEINLPTGYTIDTGKISSVARRYVVGMWESSYSSGEIYTNTRVGVLHIDPASPSSIFFGRAGGNDSPALPDKSNGNDLYNDAGYHVRFTYPVSGWKA